MLTQSKAEIYKPRQPLSPFTIAPFENEPSTYVQVAKQSEWVLAMQEENRALMG